MAGQRGSAGTGSGRARGVRHRRSEFGRSGSSAPREVRQLLVRGQSLAAGMSDYLVRQLGETRNLDVRLSPRVVDGRGKGHLEALTLEDVRTGRQEEVLAAAVFVLIGAEPHTEWLRDVVELDERWVHSYRPRHPAVRMADVTLAAAVRDKCARDVRCWGRSLRVGETCRRCRRGRLGHRGLCPPLPAVLMTGRHLSSSHSSDNPIVGEQRAVVGVQHMM